MNDRQILLYFAWSRPGETGAPLTVIDDRFPTVFELRRLFYPNFEALADPVHIDQGIGGFLDHIQKPNFVAVAEQAQAQTGRPVRVVERVADDGVAVTLLDSALASPARTPSSSSASTSFRTGQSAQPAEVEAIAEFLKDPDQT